MNRRKFIKKANTGAVAIATSATGITSLTGACSASSNVSKKNVAKEESIKSWDFLRPGDTIDVIAPSSPPSDPQLTIKEVKNYFEGKLLKVNIPKDMIHPTPILNEANTLENRVEFIVEALMNPNSKAIWAVLGGGWGTELLGLLKKRLETLELPFYKPILGYSDLTALHIFFNQYLQGTSLHCIELEANGSIGAGWNKSKIEPVLDVLLGRTPTVSYEVQLLNPDTMKKSIPVVTKIVGGNALLLSALYGSNDFTTDTKNKTLFIESVALDSGEVSRILNGFRYSNAMQEANAVLLGDFVRQGGHPNPSLAQEQFNVIRRFLAKNLDIPVFYSSSFGHGPVNHPLPLNTYATFTSGDSGDKAVMKISANNTDGFS